MTVGLDLSINSTGVCIEFDSGEMMYAVITGKLTKKQREFRHSGFEYVEYGKIDPSNCDSFQEREFKKSANIVSICESIVSLITRVRPDDESVLCIIEGISYGSKKSSVLSDLSGLNHCVRYALMRAGFDYLIEAPSQIKKFAVGSGSADKTAMTAAWKMCQPDWSEIDSIKTDDLADAYFLCKYGCEKCYTK